MKKRILSLLLVAVMLSALVACGGGEEGSSLTPGSDVNAGSVNGSVTDTDSSSSSGFFVPAEVPLDQMAGKTFIIIQHSPIEDPFGYSQDSFVAQLAADRVSEIESAWGCTLQFEQVPYDDNFVSAMQAKGFAVADAGDLIFSNNNAQLRKTLGTGGETSLMVNLLAFDDILNFWDTDKWGNITSRETMMAGGDFYGLTPALWYNCTPLPYYTVVYSKDLLAEFETDDPQELWEQEAWDRDAMLDIITSCYDDTMGEPIYGMSATMMHMVRASYLTAGVDAVIINEIHRDDTVDWTYGMTDASALEAMQWLKTSITRNRKYFNNGADNPVGSGSWTAQNAYISGQSAMCLTSYRTLFDSIALTSENFALIPWAGAEANTMSGFYENCYSVAIPGFAQDYTLSAHLMSTLFEGLGDVETSDDIVRYYKETYFDSDLDVEFLLMKGANLQYSYWPNGGDTALKAIAADLMNSSSIKNLVEKTVPSVSEVVETNIVPNAVALEKYRQNGYFD